MESLVWYASYGSNLLRERFMKYIKGGIAPGATFSHVGCTDKSPPLKDSQIILNHQLYFSQKIEGWENLGVGFVEHKAKPENRTFARMYLITQEQLEQIIWQENSISKFDNLPKIDFEKVIEKGMLKIAKYLYGGILFLGRKETHPIITFTATWNDTNIKYCQPGTKYLKVIADGIRETYSFSDNEIVSYFGGIPGIKDRIARAELQLIIASKDHK